MKDVVFHLPAHPAGSCYTRHSKCSGVSSETDRLQTANSRTDSSVALHSASSWLANKTCAAEALDTGLGDGEDNSEAKVTDLTKKIYWAWKRSES